MAENHASKAAAETENERDFVLSRVFDAPRSLVFKTWTDPKHMARWWGPKPFTCPVCEMDARPGGHYRIVMRAPDGADYPIKGTYREVVEPERLVFTMDCTEHPAAWHDMVNPNRGADPNPAGEMLATITFDELGSQTRVTIRIRFQSAAVRDSMVKMGMNEGWSQSLDRLQQLLQDSDDSSRSTRN